VADVPNVDCASCRQFNKRTILLLLTLTDSWPVMNKHIAYFECCTVYKRLMTASSVADSWDWGGPAYLSENTWNLKICGKLARTREHNGQLGHLPYQVSDRGSTIHFALQFCYPALHTLRCRWRTYVLQTIFFFVNSSFSFNNGCTELNTDSWVNTVDQNFHMAKNLANFGRGTLS